MFYQMAILLSKKKLAEAFSVSERSVALWQSDGMPLASKRGTQNVYDLAACIKWKLDQTKGRVKSENTDYVREKARLAKAQADRTEQQVLAQHGTLLRKQDAVRLWSAAMAQIKTNVLSIPAMIRQVMPDMSTHAYKLVDDTCRTILRDLHENMMDVELPTDE
jgi:phage terminase Nu1 subunit (DNA packaging protein)